MNRALQKPYFSPGQRVDVDPGPSKVRLSLPEQGEEEEG
jgi:hypothetical protein